MYSGLKGNLKNSITEGNKNKKQERKKRCKTRDKVNGSIDNVRTW